MKIRKRHILVAVLGAVLVLSLVSSSAPGWSELRSSPQRWTIYSDVLGDDWLIVQAYANIVGERRKSFDGPDDTVLTNEASTFGWSYDNPRYYWWYAYLPASQNHEIKVRNWYNDYFPTPSRPRIMSALGWDNAQASSIEDPLLYALDTLWNYALSFLHLPFPSPWGLLYQTQPDVTVIYDNDFRGATFRYNNDPDLQGANWLWYITSPVNPGYYYMEEYARGEAGYSFITPWGSTFVKEADVDIYFFFYFSLYRS